MVSAAQNSRSSFRVGVPFLDGQNRTVGRNEPHLRDGQPKIWYRGLCELPHAPSLLSLILETGPLARIGPNELITDDPHLIRHMSKPSSRYERSDWYGSMKLTDVDNVFSTRDGALHDVVKKQLAPGVRIASITAVPAFGELSSSANSHEVFRKKQQHRGT